MPFRKGALLASIVCLAVVACAQSAWRDGGQYSVATEKGDFSVVKSLKLESDGVHISVYCNRFPQRPSDVDVAKLYIAGRYSDKPDDELGMQDLPLRRQASFELSPQLIRVVPVESSGLEACEMWRKARVVAAEERTRLAEEREQRQQDRWAVEVHKLREALRVAKANRGEELLTHQRYHDALVKIVQLERRVVELEATRDN